MEIYRNVKNAALVLPIAAFVACSNLDDAQYAEIRELAMDQAGLTIVEAGDSSRTVRVFSNGDVSVSQLDDASWCAVDKTSFSGDSRLTVLVCDNKGGFRRMARFLLSLNGGEKTDTLVVKQEGIVAELDCTAPYSKVNGAEVDVAEFSINTNIALGQTARTISYLSGAKDWINNVAVDGDKIVVSTLPTGSDHTSIARLSSSFVDGWGVPLNVDLFVTASNKDGKFGTKISFAEARSYVGKGSIKDDIYLEGVIVSDWNSKNMEENPSVSYDKVDVSVNEHTAYIQDLDGTSGFRIRLTPDTPNKLAFNTKVELSLTGVTVVREDSPERYTLDNVRGENMVSSVNDGTPFVVKKEKTIAELTDSDVYTYVSLKNTEFVHKEGAFTNVYENYALKSSVNDFLSGNNNRLDGWATLLIDGDGNGIYAPINMLCTWRRDGNGVPQGVGVTKGIIVHNTLSRYGNVGKYQIRVLDKSGFCQEWNGESQYKDFADYNGDPHQYRYGLWGGFNAKYKDPGNKEARCNSFIPSDDIGADHTVPNVELTFENKIPTADYPMAKSNSYTNKEVLSGTVSTGGIGVDLARYAMRLSMEIKGWYKWDNETITGYNGLCYDFSTKGISGEKFYFHYTYSVGTISATTSQYFPAHWCVEYSIDGGNTYTLVKDNVTGEDYTHLRTLPWWDITIAGVKYYTTTSCGLGATQHVAVLPAEVFGKDKVRIRLRPYDDVMSIFPINWKDDTETAHVHYNTSVTGTIINIETVNFRYR